MRTSATPPAQREALLTFQRDIDDICPDTTVQECHQRIISKRLSERRRSDSERTVVAHLQTLRRIAITNPLPVVQEPARSHIQSALGDDAPQQTYSLEASHVLADRTSVGALQLAQEGHAFYPEDDAVAHLVAHLSSGQNILVNRANAGQGKPDVL